MPNIWKNKIHVPNHQPEMGILPMFVLVDGIGCNPWKTRTKKTCRICRQWGLCGPPGGPLNDLLPSDWSHSVTNPNLRFCTRDAGTGVDSKANARIQENQNIFGGYLETVVSWCTVSNSINIGMGSFWKLFFRGIRHQPCECSHCMSLHDQGCSCCTDLLCRVCPPTWERAQPVRPSGP